MLKSKKQAKTFQATGRWARSLIFSIILGAITLPVVALAQSDASVELIDATPASDASDLPGMDAAPVAMAIAPAAPQVAEAPKNQPTSIAKLSTEIMNILIPVFVTLIGALATMLLNWVRRKAKLEVSDKQISHWSTYAEVGAARAGEWARNKAMTMTEDKTVPGPEIMEVAVNFALDMGIEHGLPVMGREKLEGLIESHLHRKRG